MAPSKQAGRLPLVDLNRQHANLKPEIDEAIARVFESSDFILGGEARGFEAEFAALCESKYAIACGNGTDALELALWAVGVKPGDEVISVTHTFAATAEAIIRAGGVPVYVDVSPDTLLMDIDLVGNAITPRTKAIVPVHLYGSCVDMVALMELARRRGLKVVEDAAQAHGARIGGKRAGSFGDAATFSFYPGKNLGAVGDAGAVVTSDPEVADLVARARDHGRTAKYEHGFVGRNSRMDDLPQVRPVATHEGEPIHHLLVVECDKRDAVRERLDAAGIATGIHYPIPLHLQPAFAESPPLSLPVAEKAAGRILSLPMFPEMADGDVDRVVAALSDAVHALEVAGRR